MKRVGIICTGISNTGSIYNVIKYLGYEPVLLNGDDDLINLKKIILPGVGHFDSGMRALKEKGFISKLKDFAKNKENFILGICLGMQMLCNSSEEGENEGLGLINADVMHFKSISKNETIYPHMGWNEIEIKKPNLLLNNESVYRFYFVHSYCVIPRISDITIATCNYGVKFCAVFGKDNIYGVQFHPEKSHKFGLSLIENFLNI